MKKSIFFILLLSIISANLYCNALKSNPEDKSKSSIYNISDEDIINKNSYTKSVSKTKSGNNTTTISVSKFSGIEKLLTLSPDNKSITININAKIHNGDLRLVICDSESIIHEFDLSEENQSYTLYSSNKKYYLKAVGDNTKYSLEISYTIKKNEIDKFNVTVL